MHTRRPHETQADPSDEQVAGWLRDYAERADPADRERITLAHSS